MMTKVKGQASLMGRQMLVADSEFAAVSEGRIRIRIGAIIFMVALLIAVLRLAEISLLSPKASQGTKIVKAIPFRADIVDRRGEVLATTLATYTLNARPRYVWDAEETADKLRMLYPAMDRADLVERLSRKTDQVSIRRGLTPKERQAVFALGLPGLIFEVQPQRVYPHGNLGAHLIGFSDPDMKGLGGAEFAFDDRLSEENAPPTMLSMDLRVQNALTEELAVSLEHFKAKTNAGVVLNIKTGEIIAMASLPNFDSNVPNAAPTQNGFNHATMSTYELGSVFKPITMAMALEEGITDLTEEFPVHEPLVVRGNNIKDDHPSAHPMAMPEILAQSSNRGTALMAMSAGGDKQRAFLRKLGLFDPVPIELRESTAPQVQSEWQDITTVTVSYGHGISVTPLALTVATAALLNDGVYVKPTVLKRDAANPAERRRVVSPETSQTLRDLMRYVATNGTGKNARVRGYSVMGKTGTADKPNGDSYDENNLVSSFIAAFPYEDPTYAVFITFDEPKAVPGTYGYATAGWNAAPTAGKVIERIAPMLGVPQRFDPESSYSPFSNQGALP